MNDHAPVDEVLVATYAQRLSENLPRIAERIAAAGGPNVVLLPVSKGQPVEAAVAAQRAGLTMLGENYAQELSAKATHPEVADAATSAAANGQPIEWHFIGQLQRNRVKSVAPYVSLWQSVDRARVARAIALHAPGAPVLAQVNLAADPTKAGCGFDELDELVDTIREFELDLQGFMGVGAADDDAATSAGFARLRRAVDAHGLSICSMGMTGDLELAIAEGATMVRVGTALFGPRR